MMRSFRDDSSLDAVRGDSLEPDGKQEAGRIDDLDLLPHPGSQRPRQVARITAFDYSPGPVTSRKKRWQLSALSRHIALKVS